MTISLSSSSDLWESELIFRGPTVENIASTLPNPNKLLTINVVTTGCFNYIDPLESTRTTLIAGLHSEHLRLLLQMKHLQKLLSVESKTVVFLNEDSYLEHTKKSPIVLSFSDREKALKSCPHPPDYIVRFKSDSELKKLAYKIQPYILLKGDEYIGKKIALARGNCQAVLFKSNNGVSASEMNLEWLKNNNV